MKVKVKEKDIKKTVEVLEKLTNLALHSKNFTFEDYKEIKKARDSLKKRLGDEAN